MITEKCDLFNKILLDFSEHGLRHAILGSTESIDCSESKKDIDILVDIKSESLMKRLLLKRGFFVDPRLSERKYLYGVNRFLYFRSLRTNLRIDVCFQLTVDSINGNREVVPLHKKLQEDAFAGIEQDEGDSSRYRLSKKVDFVYLFAREFFNHQLRPNRVQEILYDWQRLSQAEKCYVNDVLPLLFFNFAPRITEALDNQALYGLFSKYLRYRNY